MKFRHNIHEYHDGITVQHTEETKLPSGLIVLTHIGLTRVEVAPHWIPDGIIVEPSELNIDASGLVDQSNVTHSTLTENFVDIAPDIIERVRKIGKVATVNFSTYKHASPDQLAKIEFDMMKLSSLLHSGLARPEGAASQDLPGFYL